MSTTPFPRVIIYSLPEKVDVDDDDDDDDDDDYETSLFTFFDKTTSSWKIDASTSMFCLSYITKNKLAAYTLLHALAEHITQYFINSTASELIEDEEKQKWITSINNHRDVIDNILLEESIDYQEIWQLSNPIEEITTDITSAFQKNRHNQSEIRLHNFLASENVLPARFRRNPSYLHIPMLYKDDEHEECQPCHIYLTFLDSPSSDIRKNIVRFKTFFERLVEEEIAGCSEE